MNQMIESLYEDIQDADFFSDLEEPSIEIKDGKIELDAITHYGKDISYEPCGNASYPRVSYEAEFIFAKISYDEKINKFSITFSNDRDRNEFNEILGSSEEVIQSLGYEMKFQDLEAA